MPNFADFLAKNTIIPSNTLPLIHSTPAYHLRSIANSDTIIPQPCDVFTPDDLTYFFVGRPAYKHHAGPGETPAWELPCCFIFEYTSISPFKRVFPFDSGALYNKKYPSYISLMDMSEFNSASIVDSPSRIIGAYFSNTSSYFSMSAVSKETFESTFSPSPFDAEALALHKLALESNSSNFDDRRMTIEVQTDKIVNLSITTPLAVIAPQVYFDDQNFLEKVTISWKAEPIGYPIHSLNLSQYYATIYTLVKDFYDTLGAFK